MSCRSISVPLLTSITVPPLPVVEMFLFSRSSAAAAVAAAAAAAVAAAAADAPTAAEDDDDDYDNDDDDDYADEYDLATAASFFLEFRNQLLPCQLTP